MNSSFMNEKSIVTGWNSLYDWAKEIILPHSEKQFTACRSFAKDVGDAYTFEVELPGFTKDDVEISAVESKLTVKAVKEDRQKTHVINLYDLVAIEHISAKMQNGLLLLRMPKKEVMKASGALKIKIE